MFPSDHFIADEARFRAHVGRAIEAVAADPERIVLLGIKPERADAGFGYIERGPRVDGASGTWTVAGFREKPDPVTAAALVRSGALWNSFVMVFRASHLLDLIEAVRPQDVRALQTADEDGYERVTPWNFSSGFLAYIPDQLAVVEADDTGWSDWGTPEAVERTFTERGVVPPWLLPGAPSAALAAAM
jgi:mannose-1-phosphate guanylyltransferase